MRLHHHSFWNVFFLGKHGVNEEKMETKILKSHAVGKGGGRP